MNPSISFLWGEQSSAGGSGVRLLPLGTDCVQQPSLRGNCVQHSAPGASPGACPRVAASAAASARHGSSGSRTVATHRAAFTLVELMIVIGIIGILTAISVPVVMQSLAKARNAAIKAEIDMLHMAIMNYKNEYGSFPPASASNAPNHILRLFPNSRGQYPNYPVKKQFTEDKNQNRVLDAAQQEDANGNNSLDGLFDTIPLGPDTALAFWLFGYSSNPREPTVGETKPLFDFDRSRLESQSNFFTGRYRSTNALNSGVYRYVDSANYYFVSSGRRFPTPWVEFNPTTAAMAVGEDSSTTPPNGLIDTLGAATEDANSNGLLDRGEPFNNATFQIIHPGRDGEFGTDDDLSNFWPGTRREYLDSLK